MQLPDADVLGPRDEKLDQLADSAGQTRGLLTVDGGFNNVRVRTAGVEKWHQLARVLLRDVHGDAARVLAEPDLMGQPVENIANGPAFAA